MPQSRRCRASPIFCPPNVSSMLREAANLFARLRAQLASLRQFSRHAVTDACKIAFLAHSFFVPEFLTARRAGRPLTQEEFYRPSQPLSSKQERASSRIAARKSDVESLIELPEGQPLSKSPMTSTNPSAAPDFVSGLACSRHASFY